MAKAGIMMQKKGDINAEVQKFKISSIAVPTPNERYNPPSLLSINSTDGKNTPASPKPIVEFPSSYRSSLPSASFVHFDTPVTLSPSVASAAGIRGTDLPDLFPSPQYRKAGIYSRCKQKLSDGCCFADSHESVSPCIQENGNGEDSSFKKSIGESFEYSTSSIEKKTGSQYSSTRYSNHTVSKVDVDNLFGSDIIHTEGGVLSRPITNADFVSHDAADAGRNIVTEAELCSPVKLRHLPTVKENCRTVMKGESLPKSDTNRNSDLKSSSYQGTNNYVIPTACTGQAATGNSFAANSQQVKLQLGVTTSRLQATMQATCDTNGIHTAERMSFQVSETIGSGTLLPFFQLQQQRQRMQLAQQQQQLMQQQRLLKQQQDLQEQQVLEQEKLFEEQLAQQQQLILKHQSQQQQLLQQELLCLQANMQQQQQQQLVIGEPGQPCLINSVPAPPTENSLEGSGDKNDEGAIAGVVQFAHTAKECKEKSKPLEILQSTVEKKGKQDIKPTPVVTRQNADTDKIESYVVKQTSSKKEFGEIVTSQSHNKHGFGAEHENTKHNVRRCGSDQKKQSSINRHMPCTSSKHGLPEKSHSRKDCCFVTIPTCHHICFRPSRSATSDVHDQYPSSCKSASPSAKSGDSGNFSFSDSASHIGSVDENPRGYCVNDSKFPKVVKDKCVADAAFPQDIECTYTPSGQHIESCTAKYVFATNQTPGPSAHSPLEAKVISPQDHESYSGNLLTNPQVTFHMVQSSAKGQAARAPSAPSDTSCSTTAYPHDIEGKLSPSGHHLQSCRARYVFVGPDGQPGAGGTPPGTYVVLPLLRALPVGVQSPGKSPSTARVHIQLRPQPATQQ